MNSFLYAKEISLLDALGKSAVKFLVVGGHAVISHGHFRPAKHLDLWLLPSEENITRFAAVFAGLDMPLPPELIARLAQQDMHELIPGWDIEVLTGVKGLEFETAFSHASIMYVQDVQYCVLSLEDLIWNKTALCRKQDLEDLRELNALPPPLDEIASIVFPLPEFTAVPIPQ